MRRLPARAVARQGRVIHAIIQLDAGASAPQAVDPAREYVDGVRTREPVTGGQRKAALRLNGIERELGADGSALVHNVLVDGMTMEQVGQRRGLVTQRWKDYFSRRFQECLALGYGFATEQRPSHLNPAGRHRVQAVRRSGE